MTRGIRRGDEGCCGQLTVMRPEFCHLAGDKSAPVEDEGELVVPGTMGWHPVDDQEAVDSDVEAEFFLELAAGGIVGGFVGLSHAAGKVPAGFVGGLHQE